MENDGSEGPQSAGSRQELEQRTDHTIIRSFDAIRLLFAGLELGGKKMVSHIHRLRPEASLAAASGVLYLDDERTNSEGPYKLVAE